MNNVSIKVAAKYDLKDSSWTYKGFHGFLHTFFPVGQTGPAVTTFLSRHAVRTIFFATDDDYIHWYWNDQDLIFIREEFFRRLKKNKGYLRKLQADWDKKIKRFDVVIRQADKIDFTKLSNQGIVKFYKVFYKAYLGEFKYFMALGDAVSMHADRYLVPEFQKTIGTDFPIVFPKLLATKYRSFIEQEKLDREKLQKIMARKGKLDPTALAKHAQRYFYINNNYAKGIKLTAADFYEILKKDLKSKRSDTPKNQTAQLKEKKHLIKKYQLSDWQKTLLYIMDEFFKIQDIRKKYVLISNFYQIQLLREISRRAKIPFDVLKYSIFPEVAGILGAKFTKKDLAGRLTGCACLSTRTGFSLMNGLEYRKLFNYFNSSRTKQTELKGMTASLGRATGKVKKILKIHDMINMEQGDILVTSMTRPEMMPVMRLASAIITDEGGVTSHAAIISRELKIPCIIGVKIATQMLNDGDEVEVDADKGIIIVLKKN